MGWTLYDSIISLTKYILRFSNKLNALLQTVIALSEYTDSAHTEVEVLFSRYRNGLDMYDYCK